MSRPSASEAPARRPVLVWIERLVTGALFVFVAVRLAPQVGALTGIAPAGVETPPLALVTLDGDTLGPAALRGRVVVVNFWATWCLPCRLEAPSLQALHERFDTADVVVLGLSTDVGSVAPVRGFVRDHGITYPVGRATWDHQRAFSGIQGIPTTLLIDRSGRVRHRVVGYFAPPALSAAVRRLVREPLSDGRGAVP